MPSVVFHAGALAEDGDTFTNTETAHGKQSKSNASSGPHRHAHDCLVVADSLEGARAGFAKVVDAHKRILQRVRNGEAAEGWTYEAVNAAEFLVPAMLAAGELELLRDFMAHSMVGEALHDEMVREGVGSFWAGPFGSWKSDDGHCISTFDSWMLIVRAVSALLEEQPTAQSDDALRSWLPLPAKLLHIAEYECGWRAQGSSGPVLICALLHGERLGGWEATAQVAEGMLQVECFNPAQRVEAFRLLGRARAALGQHAAACEAAESAAAEAARARYVWFEALAWRDRILWGKANATAGADEARARLRQVVARLTVAPQEVAAVLGEV